MGLCVIVYLLVEFCQTGLVPRFPTLFFSLFLLLGAMMSVFTGLCLDVIVTKDRKNYELRLIKHNE